MDSNARSLGPSFDWNSLRIPAQPSPWAHILAFGCALLLGGAAGNLIDRFIQEPRWGSGHVVDFIGYGTWFIGNVADIWIVCAVVILLIASFAGNKHSVR